MCIPLGSNCAALVADLFLLCYEKDFMLSLPDNNRANVIMAHFESNYSFYYSLIRASIIATIVLLEINGGSEHRYSSRLSGYLL